MIQKGSPCSGSNLCKGTDALKCAQVSGLFHCSHITRCGVGGKQTYRLVGELRYTFVLFASLRVGHTRFGVPYGQRIGFMAE